VVGNTTATGAEDAHHDNVAEVAAPAVTVEEVLEWNESGEYGAVHVPHGDRKHRNSSLTGRTHLCGTNRCDPGTGHCQQMTGGPLCVCVRGRYGPDCQQRTLFNVFTTVLNRS